MIEEIFIFLKDAIKDIALYVVPIDGVKFFL